MIGSLISLGNNVWPVYIEFVQIVETLCGNEFTNIDLLLTTRSRLFSLNIWMFSQM